MEYTEEEKEVLKIIIENKNRTLSIDLPEETRKILKIIINLLEKQQNEIDEKDKQIKILDETYSGAIKESKKWFDIAKDSIPKEAIRKKIEELKDKEQEFTDEQGYWGDSSIQHKIEILEELLGDE